MLETIGEYSTLIRGNIEPAAPKQYLLIVSEVRLLREGVAGVVDGHPVLEVAGLYETLREALLALRNYDGATVLLDGSFPGGLEAVRTIHEVAPSACVIAFAVSETEENIVAWARAGAAGYIPANAALHELAHCIEGISRGEQICSAALASRLIRSLRAPQVAIEPPRASCVPVPLTTREQEIIRMLAEGLSNKEIARNLHIELSTTKTHVHNLLGKLGLQRRGQIASWSHKQDRRS